MALLPIIYYGWLAGRDGNPTPDCQRILAARPALLIANAFTAQPRRPNVNPTVRALLRSYGTRLYAYLPTAWGTADGAWLHAEADAARAMGFDGVFLDEAPIFQQASAAAPVAALARSLRALGFGIIINTGVAGTAEPVMDVADILMVEHQWRAFAAACPWMHAYPAERFMGCSSNEPDAHRMLGYRLTGQRAIRDSAEAERLGIGWLAATDRFVEVPRWLDRYAAARRILPPLARLRPVDGIPA